MIQEGVELGVDELWAVVRDQRDRVDRLVAQAARQQEELARLRGENRRLIGLVGSSESISRGSITDAGDSSAEYATIATNDAILTPASTATELRSSALPSPHSVVPRHHLSATTGARALIAVVVLGVCALTAGRVAPGHTGAAPRPAQVAHVYAP